VPPSVRASAPTGSSRLEGWDGGGMG
jgi:hypothetical protein